MPDPRIPTNTLALTMRAGQEIAVLLNEELAPGTHSATWDATGMASGLYFYRLEAVSVEDPSKSGSTSSPRRFVDVKKMVLLR